jgi:hypothetical protein
MKKNNTDNYPVTEELKITDKYNEIPQLVGINYNLLMLEVQLEFMNPNKTVSLVFEDVRGFRVLDEGHLLDFWYNNSGGWLRRVKSGGWFDQEKKREGFGFGEFELENYDEYLVVGMGMCLSLIGGSDPVITKELKN